MLVVATLVLLVLRFRETWRFAPLLLPMIVMVHFVVPGALGAVKYSFAPPGGLVAEQSNDKIEAGSGRVADIGPTLALQREADSRLWVRNAANIRSRHECPHSR